MKKQWNHMNYLLILSLFSSIFITGCASKTIKLNETERFAYAYMLNGNSLLKISTKKENNLGKNIELIQLKENGFQPNYENSWSNCLSNSDNNSNSICSSSYTKSSYPPWYIIRTAIRTGLVLGTNLLRGRVIYRRSFVRAKMEKAIDNNKLEVYRQVLINMKKAYAIRNFEYSKAELDASLISSKGSSEYLLNKSVTKDFSLLKYMNNVAEDIQMKAVEENIKHLKQINNPSEAVQIMAIRKNYQAIKYIKNPSEQAQLAAVNAAVKKNKDVFKYIKKPSEQAQLAAVKEKGHYIKNIKKPSEKVQLAAVKQNGHVVKYIENPTEKVGVESVSGDQPLSIAYIKDPSEKVQLAAINNNSGEYGEAILYIKKPASSVRNHPRVIFFLNKRSAIGASSTSKSSDRNNSSTNSSHSSAPQRTCRSVRKVKTVYVLGGRPGQTTQQHYYEEECS